MHACPAYCVICFLHDFDWLLLYIFVAKENRSISTTDD